MPASCLTLIKQGHRLSSQDSTLEVEKVGPESIIIVNESEEAAVEMLTDKSGIEKEEQK